MSASVSVVIISLDGRVSWSVMGVGGVERSAVAVPHHKLMIGRMEIIFVWCKVLRRHVVEICRK